MEDLEKGYFTFHHTDADGRSCTVSFHSENWFDTLNKFVHFLQGSGFSLDNDSVGINKSKHGVDPNMFNSLTTFKQ